MERLVDQINDAVVVGAAERVRVGGGDSSVPGRRPRRRRTSPWRSSWHDVNQTCALSFAQNTALLFGGHRDCLERGGRLTITVAWQHRAGRLRTSLARLERQTGTSSGRRRCLRLRGNSQPSGACSAGIRSAQVGGRCVRCLPEDVMRLRLERHERPAVRADGPIHSCGVTLRTPPAAPHA
jgi:hypothetical protein